MARCVNPCDLQRSPPDACQVATDTRNSPPPDRGPGVSAPSPRGENAREGDSWGSLSAPEGQDPPYPVRASERGSLPGTEAFSCYFLSPERTRMGRLGQGVLVAHLQGISLGLSLRRFGLRPR